jgi:hypothetical protein
MDRVTRIERAVAVASRHAERFPLSRPCDIYKVLFQACMGPEHAVANTEGAREWLAKEWGAVQANPREELREDITVHFPVCRLNLRPAKARGMDQRAILDSFVGLAREFPKDRALLAASWTEVSGMIGDWRLRTSGAEGLKTFCRLVEEGNFPAVHHSREYGEAYKPAYRLVSPGAVRGL